MVTGLVHTAAGGTGVRAVAVSMQGGGAGAARVLQHGRPVLRCGGSGCLSLGCAGAGGADSGGADLSGLAAGAWGCAGACPSPRLARLGLPAPSTAMELSSQHSHPRAWWHVTVPAGDPHPGIAGVGAEACLCGSGGFGVWGRHWGKVCLRKWVLGTHCCFGVPRTCPPCDLWVLRLRGSWLQPRAVAICAG